MDTLLYKITNQLINKSFLSALALLFISTSVFAQAPETMSYQAVVRDASGNLVESSDVGMQISIIQGSASGTDVYVETQTPTTNENGLISIQIGLGSVVSGDFSTIDWGADIYFIKTETDPLGGTSYSITGTSQLVSVPYALYSKTAENVSNDQVDDADNDPTNELQDWTNLPNIPASFADDIDDVDDADNDPTNELQDWTNLPNIPAGFADDIDNVDDADNDPTNELQDWTNLPNIPAGFADDIDDVDDADNDPTNELQDWTNLPNIPAGFADDIDNVDDADNDPTNELQDWTNLPNIPAGFADDIDDVDDADNDPTNELQDWTNLPNIPAGFADDIDNVDDADNDPTNELQDWTNLPNIPTGFADDIDNVDDADNDPTNELQTISRSGNTVTLSNGGGTFTDSVGINTQGATPGDLLYWNGAEWAIVPVGSPGQVLQLNSSGVPEWLGSGYASVTTDPAANIAASQADFSGTVTADGGSTVTARGFVYSTSPAPNLTDDVVIVGSGVGSFDTTVTGLTVGATYYVRAYATNSSGTIYGNEVSFATSSSYALGDTGPAGGLVFYDKGFYSDGWRYMEANPSDLSTGTDWGCSGTLIPGSQPSAIGNGPQNTQDIVSNCGGTNIAARLCNNYSFNGFTDWFLPARQSVDQMYVNLYLQGLGSFNGLSTYWSSTENNSISAQGVSFNTGNTINNNKVSSYRVRAARRF